MVKIALIQARNEDDPALVHELECFQNRALNATFEAFNLITDPFSFSDIETFDVFMFGGSGDYSVTNLESGWGDRLIELMSTIIKENRPTFASCFGFQALVVALGGRVERDPARAEVGTFELTLTDAGKKDPVFGNLPTRFNAQLGHNDSATTLPDRLVHLAGSERCIYQAVRVADSPIYATQFHPELTKADNIFRFLRYLQAYRPELNTQQATEEAESIHQESPQANKLIFNFLEELS